VDDHGRIIADRRDYEAIYTLVSDLFTAVASGGITKHVRETVNAIAFLTRDDDGRDTGESVSVAKLARHMGLDKSSVSRRVRKAIEGGWLVNQADKPGRPMEIVLGDSLPAEQPALPSPDDLFADDDPTDPSDAPPAGAAGAAETTTTEGSPSGEQDPPDGDGDETTHRVHNTPADACNGATPPENPCPDAEKTVACPVATSPQPPYNGQESEPLHATPEPVQRPATPKSASRHGK